MSELSAVIDELKRRLKVGLDDLLIFEGDAEVWGKWQRQLPCIHIYELESKTVEADGKAQQLAGRGKILTRLLIQVEFVGKLTNIGQVFSQGREMRERLRKSIELDERFKERKGLVD